MIFCWIGSLFSFRYATKSVIPPSYWNSTLCPSARSSTIEIFMPRVRNAVSRIRSSSVVKLSSSVSKISWSGRNVIVVP